MTDQSSARAAVPAGLSPYVGPRPYGEADHHVFFGRDREAAEVCSLWNARKVLFGVTEREAPAILRAAAAHRAAIFSFRNLAVRASHLLSNTIAILSVHQYLHILRRRCGGKDAG